MTSQTPEEKCCDKCYSTYTTDDYPDHQTLDACINRDCECHTQDTTEIEEKIRIALGELGATWEDPELVVKNVLDIFRHQIQKAQENTIKEVIEIIESVQLVATKKHKNDTTPEKAKIINDWLMPEVKRNIIEAVKTLHRPKLDQDTVITIAKEQLKENLDLIKRVENG